MIITKSNNQTFVTNYFFFSNDEMIFETIMGRQVIKITDIGSVRDNDYQTPDEAEYDQREDQPEPYQY